MNTQLTQNLISIIGTVIVLGLAYLAKQKGWLGSWARKTEAVVDPVVHVAEDVFANGHEAVVAHDYKHASIASDAARVATEVECLILQFAGAANKNVSQLTAPDLQNVIAYVLHSLSPIDLHKVTPKTVVDAHAKLVAAHNTLAADATFQAAQTAAAYQISAPVA